MTEVIDFTKNDPIFYRDGVAKGGVAIPFVLTAGSFINFDGTASTVCTGRLKLKGTHRVIWAQAIAMADAQGAKAAAASTEPVITIAYGSTGLLSSGDATALCVITCSGAGAAGTLWEPATFTETQVDEGKDLVAILTTAAASATSANQDGGASIIVWLCPEKAPA